MGCVYSFITNTAQEYELVRAVGSNHVEHVKSVLLKKDLDLNEPDPDDPLGNTPLTLAASLNNRDIVTLLVQKQGVQINKANRNGSTALYYAAKNNNDAILVTLLDWGADQNIGMGIGHTPLIIAIENQYNDIVRLLLERPGVDVNTMDTAGNTPLIKAVETGNTMVVTMLLKKGADVSAQNFNGDSPRSCAIGLPNEAEMLSILR